MIKFTSSAQLTFSIQIEGTRKISHEATHRDLPGKLLLWIGEKYLSRRRKMIKFNSQAVLDRVCNGRWSPMDHGVIHPPMKCQESVNAHVSPLKKKKKKNYTPVPANHLSARLSSKVKRWRPNKWSIEGFICSCLIYGYSYLTPIIPLLIIPRLSDSLLFHIPHMKVGKTEKMKLYINDIVCDECRVLWNSL